MIVYLLNIYFGKLFGPEKYGQIAYQIFIAKFFLILNVGAISGYIYSAYSNSKSDIISSRVFISYYFFQLIISSAIIFLIVYAIGLPFYWGVLFFISIIPIYIVEPILRVKRIFWPSLMPELLLTGCIFLSVYLSGTENLEINAIFKYTIWLLLGSSTLILLLILRSLPLESNRSLSRKVSFESYIKLLKKGSILYIGSGLFLIYLFVDRFFIEMTFSKEFFSTYMFAFQLATISAFVITSMNFVYSVDIGEMYRNKTLTYSLFSKKFKWVMFSGLISYLLVIAISYILQQYYLTEYKELTLITSILALGLVIFYCSGNISPVLFYDNKLNPFIFLLGIVVVLMLFVNGIAHIYLLSPYYIVTISSFLLTVYSIIVIKGSLKVVTRLDAENSINLIKKD